MNKLSVITINRNNADGLLKTINSVFNQTKPPFEFIVIDGASTDKSPEIVEHFRERLNYAVSEKDTGIYQAMNKGINKASGEYLLFLHSGDWLYNNQVIESVLPLLKGADVISGDINIYDAGKWHLMSSENEITVGLFQYLSLYHQATFISKKLFERFGLYDETFKSTGDYEFFIRALLANNSTYKHIPLVISNFVADGMSNDPAMRAINAEEWQRSWNLHFNKAILKEFDQHRALINSAELKWGRRLTKLIPF